jgi:hypothetical protein
MNFDWKTGASFRRLNVNENVKNRLNLMVDESMAGGGSFGAVHWRIGMFRRRTHLQRFLTFGCGKRTVTADKET